MTQTIAYLSRSWRYLWILGAAMLVIFGFAIDGTSEVGHHAALILGGIAVGLGISKQ